MYKSDKMSVHFLVYLPIEKVNYNVYNANIKRQPNNQTRYLLGGEVTH